MGDPGIWGNNIVWNNVYSLCVLSPAGGICALPSAILLTEVILICCRRVVLQTASEAQSAFVAERAQTSRGRCLQIATAARGCSRH